MSANSSRCVVAPNPSVFEPSSPSRDGAASPLNLTINLEPGRDRLTDSWAGISQLPAEPPVVRIWRGRGRGGEGSTARRAAAPSPSSPHSSPLARRMCRVSRPSSSSGPTLDQRRRRRLASVDTATARAMARRIPACFEAGAWPGVGRQPQVCRVNLRTRTSATRLGRRRHSGPRKTFGLDPVRWTPDHWGRAVPVRESTWPELRTQGEFRSEAVRLAREPGNSMRRRRDRHPAMDIRRVRGTWWGAATQSQHLLIG
jgi:hypothetical protein